MNRAERRLRASEERKLRKYQKKKHICPDCGKPLKPCVYVGSNPHPFPEGVNEGWFERGDWVFKKDV